MYYKYRHSVILRFAPTVYLGILFGSQNKQQLFHYTPITIAQWDVHLIDFATEMAGVHCAVRTGFIYIYIDQVKKNSVALVRERTIPTERPPPVGEVSANFCG